MIIEALYSSNNFPIDNAFIQGIYIDADIQKLFIAGRMVLEDPTGQYAHHIMLGEQVTINLRNPVDNTLLRSYPLRITTFTKMSDENNPQVIRTLEIGLISDWFYAQERRTVAYKGSVSAIASEVLRGDSFFTGGRKTFIEGSSDEAFARYRSGDTQADFLSTIMKYGVHENSPLFTYMDHNSNVYVKSWSSMQTSKLPYILSPLKEPVGSTVYAEDGVLLLPMYGYNFYSRGTRLSSQRSYSFDTAHVPYNPPKQIHIDSIESESAMVRKKSPPGDGENYHWWINPQDAVGLALHDAIEYDLQLFQLVTIVDSVAARGVNIGNSLTVAFPQADSKETGEYVIRKIEEIWTKDGVFSELYLSKF